MNLKFFSTIALSLVMGASLWSCSDNDDDDITVEGEYTEALQRDFPNASRVKWERKGPYRVAEFRYNGFDTDAWYDTDARWRMTETDYGRDSSKLPAAVSSTISTSNYATWAVEDIDFYQRTDLDFYVVEMELRDMPEVYMFIAPDGTMLKVQPEPMPDVTPDTSVLP